MNKLPELVWHSMVRSVLVRLLHMSLVNPFLRRDSGRIPHDHPYPCTHVYRFVTHRFVKVGEELIAN